MELDVNMIRSTVTLTGLALFVGLMAWTWWPRRKRAYDAAAQLPFDGENDTQEPGAPR